MAKKAVKKAVAKTKVLKAPKPTVIKSNLKLRMIIADRIKEVFKSQHEVSRDAKNRGFLLPVDMLNRYLKHGNTIGSLCEEQIVWLATRLGIPITVGVGNPTLKDGRKKDTKVIVFEVPPYSEEEALNRLKTLFPDTK